MIALSAPPAATTRPTSGVWRVLTFPVTWLVVGIAVVSLPSEFLFGVGASMGSAGIAVVALVGAGVGLVFYKLMMVFVARRATPELAVPGLAREVGLGMVVGAGFIGVSFLIVVATGTYKVAWVPHHAAATIAFALVVNAGAAVVEELTFRGLLFQALEQLGGARLGRWIALAVTAGFFGGAHLLNPGATLWSSAAIAIEAGVLLGAAFMWRRTLWFPIGIHFAWNVLEGLLGIPISGQRDPGLFLTTVHGPEILTGGTFGLEASIVPVAAGLALAVPMLLTSQRRLHAHRRQP